MSDEVLFASGGLTVMRVTSLCRHMGSNDCSFETDDLGRICEG